MSTIERIEQQIEQTLQELQKKYSDELMSKLHSLRIDLQTEKQRSDKKPYIYGDRIEIIN